MTCESCEVREAVITCVSCLDEVCQECREKNTDTCMLCAGTDPAEQSDQPPTIDLASGRQRRDLGIATVETNNQRWVDTIRTVARGICRKQGTITVDDLRVYADSHDLHPKHQNAWGSVFRGKEWVADGFAQSKYKTNNARRVVVWRLA